MSGRQDARRRGDGTGGATRPTDAVSSALADEARAATPRQTLGLWWLALVGVVVAGLLLFTQGLRLYGYALGATLALLGLLRAVLPTRLVGGLAVRGRAVDVGTLLVLGAAVAVLSTTLRLG